MESAASLKLAEKPAAETARRTVPTVTAAVANPVEQIMLSDELSPEQKKAEFAKFVTFPGTKEESRTRIREYQAFEEKMQSVREAIAQQIIQLTDTETFSELKSVYDDLNNALIDFDKKMKPLTDIVEAIYVLRTNGKTLDAFKEIQADRKGEEERERRRFQLLSERQNLQNMIDSLTTEMASLKEDKVLGSFGPVLGLNFPIRRASQQRIAEIEVSYEMQKEALSMAEERSYTVCVNPRCKAVLNYVGPHYHPLGTILDPYVVIEQPEFPMPKMHLEADDKTAQIVVDPPPQPKTAGDICRHAAALVEGDRAAQHGPKERNHQNIADHWNAYLSGRLTSPLTAIDVALMMVELKIARTKLGALNPDNFVDGAGYFGVAGEIAINGKETP